MAASLAAAMGCASPGPPHAPSLGLPKPATGLTARRVGDHVELRFTVPARTTDNLPLPGVALSGSLCRQVVSVQSKACVMVGGTRTAPPSRVSTRETASWTDDLPPELTHGSSRLIAYRVALFNAAKQTAGESDAAYTVAGEAPPPVEQLQAEGSRAGVLLHWKPAVGASREILIQREDLSAPARRTGAKGERDAGPVVAELQVTAADAAQNRVLDATAKPERSYRYTAVRRLTVQLGGRALELSSAASAGVSFVLHMVYPPLAPTGLTAVGFATDATPSAPVGFAVDLIWQPVDDTGLLAGLAGYNVYREGPDGRRQLNTTPVQVPAFHDATAVATERYRYSVTAVDSKGNESAPVTGLLAPNARP